jgi:hypothetical protein
MARILTAAIFVVLLLPLSLIAQTADTTDRLDQRVAELKKELNLSDKQADDLHKIFEESRPPRQGEHGAPQAVNEADRGDRRARWNEITEKIQSVLTAEQWQKYQDYEQKRRMKMQLDALKGALNLTEKQVIQVETILEYYQGRMEEIFGGEGGGDMRKMREVMQKLRDAQDKEINDVLTDDQKDLYEKYKEDRREQTRNRRPQGGGMGPVGMH